MPRVAYYPARHLASCSSKTRNNCVPLFFPTPTHPSITTWAEEEKKEGSRLAVNPSIDSKDERDGYGRKGLLFATLRPWLRRGCKNAQNNPFFSRMKLVGPRPWTLLTARVLSFLFYRASFEDAVAVLKNWKNERRFSAWPRFPARSRITVGN